MSASPGSDVMQDLDIEVGGMSCGSCARRIEKALAGHGGVIDAGVNFAAKRARVAFDPGEAGPDEIVALIGGLGFSARPLDSEAPAAPPLDDEAPTSRDRFRRAVL